MITSIFERISNYNMEVRYALAILSWC